MSDDIRVQGDSDRPMRVQLEVSLDHRTIQALEAIADSLE